MRENRITIKPRQSSEGTSLKSYTLLKLISSAESKKGSEVFADRVLREDFSASLSMSSSHTLKFDLIFGGQDL